MRPPSDASLWRYTGFPKLLDLLETSELAIPLARLFEDPFEGAMSQPFVDAVTAQHPPGTDVLKHIKQAFRDAREMNYISCWYHAERESAAMWDLYSQGGDCIAIQTDVARFSRCLDGDRRRLMYFLSHVDYVDYKTAVVSAVDSFFHKRSSYSHEQEVRAVVRWSPDMSRGKRGEPSILRVAVELNDLIKGIRVSPSAKPWVVDLVAKLARRYDLKCTVQQSDLFSGPLY